MLIEYNFQHTSELRIPFTTFVWIKRTCHPWIFKYAPRISFNHRSLVPMSIRKRSSCFSSFKFGTLLDLWFNIAPGVLSARQRNRDSSHFTQSSKQAQTNISGLPIIIESETESECRRGAHKEKPVIFSGLSSGGLFDPKDNGFSPEFNPSSYRRCVSSWNFRGLLRAGELKKSS